MHVKVKSAYLNMEVKRQCVKLTDFPQWGSLLYYATSLGSSMGIYSGYAIYTLIEANYSLYG